MLLGEIITILILSIVNNDDLMSLLVQEGIEVEVVWKIQKYKNTKMQEVMLGKQKCCNGGLEARRGHLTSAP